MESSSCEFDNESINQAAYELTSQEPTNLSRDRNFPIIPYIDETNFDSENYTNPNLAYAEPDVVLRRKPDPWCENNGLYSPSIKSADDFDVSLSLARKWLDYLRVPFSTLLLIRSVITNMSYTLETFGHDTPVDLISTLCDVITSNWPADYPRKQDGTIEFLNDINMTDIFTVYGSVLKNGFKCRQNFVNLNKFLKRRDNFTNWTKLSSILKYLSY